VHTEHIKYFLMDYITEHLNEQDRDQVRSHLQQCSECQNHYNELIAAHDALQHTQKVLPSSAFYSTILPRVQKRLMNHRDSLWSDRKIPSRLILPLAVSALLLILLIKIPSDSSSEQEQTDALFQAVKDYSADEVVQAVSNEDTGSNVLSNPEVVSEGIAEHLQGDHFIREALLKQIESDEIVDMDMEGVLSGLNREQAEQLLSGITERKML
jgi:anti-sigma factor RsiW